MKNKKIYSLFEFIILFIFIIFISYKFCKNFNRYYKLTINNEFIGYYSSNEEYNNLLNSLYKTNENGIEVNNKVEIEPQSNKVFSYKNNYNNYNKEELINKFINKEFNIYKLQIDNNIYYFKTQEKAESFKNKIQGENNSLQLQVEKILTKDSNIINTDNLNEEEEIKKYKIVVVAKEEKQEEKKINTQKITSRGGAIKTPTIITTTTTKSKSKIIANYTYISAYFKAKNYSSHTGTDFAAPIGTQVFSWKDGVVEEAGWHGGYGNSILINHNNGQKTRYAHLSKILCRKGQKVSSGTLIGKVGSTGNSTGPHLHFEIIINGNFVNPLNYLQ